MLMNRVLDLIGELPDIFRLNACNINCRKSPCLCKNTDAVKKYICYQMYGRCKTEHRIF